jgi:mannosyl-3-phosphoglycerate phosphatase
MRPSFIIFTDLDGTLLDHFSYSFQRAAATLQYIKHRKIPLILISSKTRAELIYYQQVLDLKNLPFVVENGSAIFTPSNYFHTLPDRRPSGSNDCYILGMPYDEIRRILDALAGRFKYPLRGFHNMTIEELQTVTGLRAADLQKAMQREFSIPLLYDNRAQKILEKTVTGYGLQILYGGRFMHILGRTDKGRTLRLILQGYKAKFNNDQLRSIAVGDSLNDFAMLKASDYPILVKKHDGSYEQREKLDDVIYAPGIGPAGWSEAVLAVLKEGGNHE